MYTITTTFTEFCNHIPHYFDLVERGEHVLIVRYGRPIAELSPLLLEKKVSSWKMPGIELPLTGLSFSQSILAEREKTSQ